MHLSLLFWIQSSILSGTRRWMWQWGDCAVILCIIKIFPDWIAIKIWNYRFSLMLVSEKTLCNFREIFKTGSVVCLEISCLINRDIYFTIKLQIMSFFDTLYIEVLKSKSYVLCNLPGLKRVPCKWANNDIWSSFYWPIIILIDKLGIFIFFHLLTTSLDFNYLCSYSTSYFPSFLHIFASLSFVYLGVWKIINPMLKL